MGRKGVSKRKRAKERNVPASSGDTASNGRKPEKQPVQVVEKDKGKKKK